MEEKARLTKRAWRKQEENKLKRLDKRNKMPSSNQSDTMLFINFEEHGVNSTTSVDGRQNRIQNKIGGLFLYFNNKVNADKDTPQLNGWDRLLYSV